MAENENVENNEELEEFESVEIHETSDTERDILKSLGMDNDEAENNSETETADDETNNVTDDDTKKSQETKSETETNEEAEPAKQTPKTPEELAEAVTKSKSEFDLGKSNENEQARRTLGKYANTRLPEDAEGNLVDPATGEVVAKAGNERFYFEIARNSSGYIQKATRQLEAMQTDLQKANTQLQAYNDLHTEARNSNLSAAEQTEAVKMMAAYKQNPVSTLKYMLTDAAANGIDLNEVFGEGSNFEMGAIGKLIDEKLKPFTSQADIQRQQQQIQEDATRQATEFLTKYPDAKMHEPVLASLITKNPGLGLVDAYYQLKDFARENNLDWNSPLSEQLGQAQQQQPRQTQQQQTTTPQKKPMVSGHNAQTVAAGKQQTKQNSMGATARTDDIVRQAMEEAGFNLG
jgi:hypothetical protein